jgi:hypothetical protein
MADHDSPADKHEVISKRFAEDEAVDLAVKQAVRHALKEHGRKGNKVVVWKDGQAVWVDAPTGDDEP